MTAECCLCCIVKRIVLVCVDMLIVTKVGFQLYFLCCVAEGDVLIVLLRCVSSVVLCCNGSCVVLQRDMCLLC